MSIDAIKKASTYGEVLNRASFFLEKNNIDPHIAQWLMKERFALSLTEVLVKQRHEMANHDKETYLADVLEAKKGKPAQYIVGHEWFYDRKFKVTPQTLIPRPETEEWFASYIKQLPDNPLHVLDIGTGSGVLAISHKLERKQDIVTAVDINEETLAVASENAKNLNAAIHFQKSDMAENVTGTFDLILSNPPYIGEGEMAEMDVSVRTFEPKEALFAEEEGLYFYKKLAQTLPDYLNKKGMIILEIGYKQASAVKALFADSFPDASIEIWKDFNEHDRAVCIKTS